MYIYIYVCTYPADQRHTPKSSGGVGSSARSNQIQIFTFGTTLWCTHDMWTLGGRSIECKYRHIHVFVRIYARIMLDNAGLVEVMLRLAAMVQPLDRVRSKGKSGTNEPHSSPKRDKRMPKSGGRLDCFAPVHYRSIISLTRRG